MINTEYEYNEPQHGDPVEIWDQDTHEIRFICPRCCTLITHTWSPVIVCTDCLLRFNVIRWVDETQDAEVTVHVDTNENTK